MHHPEKNHSEEKSEVFESQQEVMKRIKEIGFARYAETLNDLSKAFYLEENKSTENLHKCICCMDERTPYGIHSAGSGILLSEKDFDKYFQESGADSISSHDGCGAAKIYCEKMGIDGDPDAVAKEWAEKMAAKKGVPHIHLGVEKDFHFARACYYDGTGKFNYSKVRGLPAGFVVGRKYMSKEASLGEGGVAKNIIFGSHGLGKELLNKENPFFFVAIAEDEKELEIMKSELSEMTKTFGEDVNFVIDGFIAPK